MVLVVVGMTETVGPAMREVATRSARAEHGQVQRRIKNAIAMINVERKGSKREARHAVCTRCITKRR